MLAASVINKTEVGTFGGGGVGPAGHSQIHTTTSNTWVWWSRPRHRHTLHIRLISVPRHWLWSQNISTPNSSDCVQCSITTVVCVCEFVLHYSQCVCLVVSSHSWWSMSVCSRSNVVATAIVCMCRWDRILSLIFFVHTHTNFVFLLLSISLVLVERVKEGNEKVLVFEYDLLVLHSGVCPCLSLYVFQMIEVRLYTMSQAGKRKKVNLKECFFRDKFWSTEKYQSKGEK